MTGKLTPIFFWVSSEKIDRGRAEAARHPENYRLLRKRRPFGHVFFLELQDANTELLAIAAITPHMCMPELIPQVSLPIVDAVAVTDADIRRRGITRVALMGTRATVESRLFGRLGNAVIDPEPGQISRVHDLYVSTVKRGRVGPYMADELRQIAGAYVAGLDVQAVVLAGTELTLAAAPTWEGVHIPAARRIEAAVHGTDYRSAAKVYSTMLAPLNRLGLTSMPNAFAVVRLNTVS